MTKIQAIATNPDRIITDRVDLLTPGLAQRMINGLLDHGFVTLRTVSGPLCVHPSQVVSVSYDRHYLVVLLNGGHAFRVTDPKHEVEQKLGIPNEPYVLGDSVVIPGKADIPLSSICWVNDEGGLITSDKIYRVLNCDQLLSDLLGLGWKRIGNIIFNPETVEKIELSNNVFIKFRHYSPTVMVPVSAASVLELLP